MLVKKSNYPHPSTWVYTWVDYTKKYGVGYVLNDKSIGVYFNDGSKIISGYESPMIFYIEKKAKIG